MKKSSLRYPIAILTACGAFLAGLTGVQKYCLSSAGKKQREAFAGETYASTAGRVAYRRKGSGSPLVLLHGIYAGASSAEWDTLLPALSEQFSVYAPDLPGFGNSCGTERPWTAYQYAQLLHEFIINVIKKPVFLCGANGGADIALVFSRLYPEQAKKLILISPEGIGGGFATDQDMRLLPLLLSPVAGTQKLLLDTSKGSMKAMLAGLYHEQAAVPEALAETLSVSARGAERAQVTYAGIKTRFYAADTRAAFEKLELPFLMIWGEENRENSCEHFYAAEKMKSFGEFVLFEKTAFFPHKENKQAFLQNAEDFLNE